MTVGLFRWVQKTFPEVTSNDLPKDLDVFLVDANGLVGHYLQPPNLPPGKVSQSQSATAYAQSWAAVAEKVCEHLSLLITTVMKQQGGGVVYVAIDGVPPQSTIARLRAERFAFAKQRQDMGELDAWVRSNLNLPQRQTPTPFTIGDAHDANFICPGSTFNDFIHKRLSIWAASFASSYAHRVVVDDGYVVGEATHNLFGTLRGEGEKYGITRDSRVGIYTSNPDGVLRLAAVPEEFGSVYLVRESLPDEKAWAEYLQGKSEGQDAAARAPQPTRPPRFLAAPADEERAYSLLMVDAAWPPLNGTSGGDWCIPHTTPNPQFFVIDGKEYRDAIIRVLVSPVGTLARYDKYRNSLYAAKRAEENNEVAAARLQQQSASGVAVDPSKNVLVDVPAVLPEVRLQDIDITAVTQPTRRRLLADFVLLGCLCGSRYLPGLSVGDVTLGEFTPIIDAYQSVRKQFADFAAGAGRANAQCFIVSDQVGGTFELDVLPMLLFRISEKEAVRLGEKNDAAARLEHTRESWLANGKMWTRFVNQVQTSWTAIPEHHKQLVVNHPYIQTERPDEVNENFRKIDELVARRCNQVWQNGQRERRVQYSDTISPGWRARYYRSRFDLREWVDERHADAADANSTFNVATEQVLKDICRAYYRGLWWTFAYFHQNKCLSWFWSYNYHYAPLACDLTYYLHNHRTQVDSLTFIAGTPADPFHVLLAVTPPTSSQVLPTSSLVVFSLPNMLEFNTLNWRVDMWGKAAQYQAVTRFPRIPRMMERIRDSLSTIGTSLTDEERSRNTLAACPSVFEVDGSQSQGRVAENTNGGEHKGAATGEAAEAAATTA